MAVAVPILGRSKIKMKPLMILIAALALGLIFLGVVLTIVGHWPGYTSWGGSNPLKYLGPALLGMWNSMFIIEIYSIWNNLQCVVNNFNNVLL